MLHKTVRQYTIVFSHGVLPVRKRNKKKPFEWTNDEELDKLAELNKKINSGLTLSSLRNDFARLEKSVAEKENQITTLKSELDFFRDLYKRGERCFKYGGIDENDLEILAHNKVTASNYIRINELITANENEITELQTMLPQVQQKLKETVKTLELAEKVAAGTWVQNLINAEKLVQQAEYYVPNGLRYADDNINQIVAKKR